MIKQLLSNVLSFPRIFAWIIKIRWLIIWQEDTESFSFHGGVSWRDCILADRLKNIPPHSGSASLHYEIPEWKRSTGSERCFCIRVPRSNFSLLPFMLRWRTPLFRASEVATSSEFPGRAKNVDGLFLSELRYFESLNRASRKREIQRLRSRRLRAYETICRKVEAILGGDPWRDVHKLTLTSNGKKMIVLI